MSQRVLSLMVSVGLALSIASSVAHATSRKLGKAATGGQLQKARKATRSIKANKPRAYFRASAVVKLAGSAFALSRGMPEASMALLLSSAVSGVAAQEAHPNVGLKDVLAVETLGALTGGTNGLVFQEIGESSRPLTTLLTGAGGIAVNWGLVKLMFPKSLDRRRYRAGE